MAPKKIIKPLNSKSTMLSFKSRKDCILKKTKELSILCDIKTCALIIDPDGNIHTFPENSCEVQEIINFKNGDKKRVVPDNLLKMVDEKLDAVNRKIEELMKSRIDIQKIEKELIQDFDDWMMTTESDASTSYTPSLEPQGFLLEDNLGEQTYQETDGDDGFWGSLHSILQSMNDEPTVESLDSILQSIDCAAGC